MTTTIKNAADDAGFITALMALPGFNNKVYIKADPADKVYTKTEADTELAKKLDVDGTNISTQADKGKALVDVLVPALATVGTDDTKKVYTKGTADTSFVKIDGDNATEVGVTAMLGKLKGDNRVVKANGDNADSILRELAAPSTDDVANVLTRNPTFMNAIKTQANADDAGFQGAVKEVMSQQHFEIPSDPSAPISADW